MSSHDSPEDSVEQPSDYRPPAWDSWSDTPETYPQQPEAAQHFEGPQHSEATASSGAGEDGLAPTEGWTLAPEYADDRRESRTRQREEARQRAERTSTEDRSGAPDPAPTDDRAQSSETGSHDPAAERAAEGPDHRLQGHLIAGRYRLEQALVNRYGCWTWRAFDQKLSRAVLAHVLPADDLRTDAVLRAARRAAVATDSRFLRVLDAVPAEGDRAAYVICEYIDGMSLEVMLKHGPLSGLEAAWVVRELADALTPMHAQGLFHQQLDPDSVIISPTGNVKIVGFLIDAALSGENPRPSADTEGWSQAEEADVHSLGQLLYACLVTRWPTLEESERSHFGMDPAPADAQGWLTPRQVRGGVSPALDAVCDQILHEVPRGGDAPLRTVGQVDQSLSRALGTADASSDLEQRVRNPIRASEHTTGRIDAGDAPAGGPPPTSGDGEATGPITSTMSPVEADSVDEAASVRTTARRKKTRATTPMLGGGPEHPRPRPGGTRPWLRILLGVVAAALLVGLLANALRGKDEGQTAGPTPDAASAPPAHTPVAITKVTDFDPEADGGSGEENRNQVNRAWDKNPETAWTTVQYQNRAKFGGLKPGVGLVLDLGKPTEVGAVKLTLQGSPTGVALYVPATRPEAATAPTNSIKSWRMVADNPKAGTSVTLAVGQQVRTRHVLVYLTSIPNVGSNKYRGAIAEITVTS